MLRGPKTNFPHVTRIHLIPVRAIKMKISSSLLLISILLINFPVCFAIDTRTFDESIKTSEERPQNFPVELTFLPNATNIRYYELGGTFQLIYRIQADYPAGDLIAVVSAELERRKWRPLQEDYLNPGLPSGHVRGWQRFNQPAKNPPQTIHQWLANWENQDGDVMSYGFIYQYDSHGKQDLKDMTVIAIFVPAQIAKEMRKKVIQDQKRGIQEKK